MAFCLNHNFINIPEREGGLYVNEKERGIEERERERERGGKEPNPLSRTEAVRVCTKN